VGVFQSCVSYGGCGVDSVPALCRCLNQRATHRCILIRQRKVFRSLVRPPHYVRRISQLIPLRHPQQHKDIAGPISPPDVAPAALAFHSCHYGAARGGPVLRPPGEHRCCGRNAQSSQGHQEHAKNHGIYESGQGERNGVARPCEGRRSALQYAFDLNLSAVCVPFGHAARQDVGAEPKR
jgi:hypothetical protein